MELKTVKLFISANLSDMILERGYLMQHAYPELRKYCTGKGLEFQVVDMKNGMFDDAFEADDDILKIYHKEIQDCKRMSHGPYFISFLGDKYGFVPIPSKIEAAVFKHIHLSCAKTGKEVKLLDDWYCLDENVIPHSFVLQPITRKFPFYNNKDPENEDSAKKDREEWCQEYLLLHELLVESFEKALKDKLITDDDMTHYIRTVTEAEITEGILDVEADNARTLCFVRRFNVIKVKDSKAGNFTDIKLFQQDIEAQVHLKRLRDEKVPGKLGEEIKKFEVNWTKGGLDVNKHLEYLSKMCAAFIEDVKKLIDESFKASSFVPVHQRLGEDHSMICDDYCKGFQGCENVINEMKNLMSIVYDQFSETDVKEVLRSKFQNSTAKVAESEISEITNSDRIDSDEDDEADDECSKNDDDDYGIHDSNNNKDAQTDKFDFKNITSRTKISESNFPELFKSAFSGSILDENRVESNLMKHVTVLKENDEKVTDYLKGKWQNIDSSHLERHHLPIVIHGESGCGKTSLFAEVLKRSRMWFPNSVQVVRFLGRSVRTNIRDLLIDLCKQIRQVYSIPDPQFDSTDDFSFLVVYFDTLLRTVAIAERPLVIGIDAIDQLEQSNSAHSMTWLPLLLPEHVHLILTTNSTTNRCLENLRLKLLLQSQCIEMQKFDAQTAADLLETWCTEEKHALTKKQKDVIKDAFANCPNPLFLKMSFDQSLKWHSYTADSYAFLAHSVKMSILKLFNDLEREYGYALIQRTLGYLSASKHGLTDMEMEDLLSLDDEVLQEIYLHHAPPRDAKIIRIPTLTWKRLKYDLHRYMTEKLIDNRRVMAWIHPEFYELATERYVIANDKELLHRRLAEYFSGKWSSQAKSLELIRIQKRSYTDVYRNVPEQVLEFGKNIYNERMLNELPFHLIYSHQFEEFTEKICQFDWIFTKAKAFSIQNVLMDFEMVLDVIQKSEIVTECSEECQFIYHVLQVAQTNIKHDVALLPVQIIGQLGPRYSGLKRVEELVKQAVSWCEETSDALLIPQAVCIPPKPRPILLHSLNVDMHVPEIVGDSCISIDNSQRYMYSIERNTEPQCDAIKAFDLMDVAASVKARPMYSKVKSIQCVGDQFLELKIYEKFDQFQPSIEIVLFNPDISPALTSLPEKTKIAAYSHSLRFMAAVSVNLPIDSAADEQGVICSVIDMKSDEAIFNMAPSNKGKSFLCLKFSLDDAYIITATWETYEIWSVSEQKCMKVIPAESCFQSYQEKTPHLYTLPDDKFLSRGIEFGDSHNMYIYNYITGEKVTTILSENEFTMDLIVLNQSKNLVAAATAERTAIEGRDEKFIYIWSTTSGTIQSICKGKGPYRCLAFCGSEDKYVLSSSGYGIQIWYVGTIENPQESALQIHQLNNHTGIIFQLIITGNQMFSASEDNTVKVWSLDLIIGECDDLLQKYNQLESGDNPNEPVKKDITAMEIVKESGVAIVTTIEGWLLYLNIHSGEIVYRELIDSSPIPAMIVTKDMEKCIVATTTGIKIWEIPDGLFWSKLEPELSVSCLVESNNILAAGIPEMFSVCHVFKLDAEGGPQHMMNVGGLFGFDKLAINTVGTQIISTVCHFPVAFDLETGDVWPRDGDSKMEKCTGLMLSSNDRYAGASSSDGSLRILDLAKRKYKMHIILNSTVKCFVFSKDSRRVITGGFRRISVWCLKSECLLYTYKRHEGMVNSLLVVADGNVLVSASDDKAIILWDLKRGRSLGHYRSHCAVKHIAATDDGSTIIYPPDGATFVGIIKPNPTLDRAIVGEMVKNWPNNDTRAVALAFSGLRNIRENTQAQLVRTKTCIVS
ncbi:uncharacterized protein LOC141900455 [Tubulanus polymorphus]|uniref:uncharacterized protein LOC141900455 n=1 Tax=Tubulanus polymorphus TaxID=672921 RepID=UPI003DA2D520